MPIDAPTIDVLRKQAIAMAMLWLTARDYEHEGGRAWFCVRASDLGLRDNVLPGKRIRVTIEAEPDESGVSASDSVPVPPSPAPVVQVVEPLTDEEMADALGSRTAWATREHFDIERACARKWGLSLKEPRE